MHRSACAASSSMIAQRDDSGQLKAWAWYAGAWNHAVKDAMQPATAKRMVINYREPGGANYVTRRLASVPRRTRQLRYLASSLIWSTTSGLARVDTSPGSWRFDIAASTRRMIFPERVLGMSGTMSTRRGLAIAPIPETTAADIRFAISADAARPGFNAT